MKMKKEEKIQLEGSRQYDTKKEIGKLKHNKKRKRLKGKNPI